MTKGNREQQIDGRTLDTTVTKKAESCPLSTDFTAHGVRGVTCNASTQSWKPAPWVLEGNVNSAVEQTMCATRKAAPGDYY